MGVVAVIELLREALVIRLFGTGAISDAYFLAVSIPTVVGGSFHAIGVRVVMPWFSLAAARDGEAAHAQMSQLFFVLLLPVVLLGWVSRHLALVLARAMGGPAIDREMLVTALTLSLPVLALTAVSAELAAYLNATERYLGVAVRRVFNSVCFVVVALLAPRQWTTFGLGLAFLFGGLAELGWLASMARPSIRHLVCGAAMADWRRLSELAASALLPTAALAFSRAGTTAEHVMAGHLPPGSVSILSYGYRAVMALARILVEGLITVIRSQASRAVAGSVEQYGRAILSQGLRLVLSLVVPVSVLLVVLRIPLAQLLFAINRTDVAEMSRAAALIAIYGCTLPAYAMGPLLATPFYAQGDTTTPSIYGILMVGLKLALSLVAMHHLGLLGIPLAHLLIGLLSVLQARWLLGRIGIRLPDWQDAWFLPRLATGAFGAGLAGLTAFTWVSPVVPAGMLGILFALALAVLAGVITYVLLETVIGMQEFRQGARWLWRTVVEARSR
jgi:putative peptidoglycan lipid II flippase